MEPPGSPRCASAPNGDAAGQVHTVAGASNGAYFSANAPWDGVSVVAVSYKGVVELDSNGELLASTPAKNAFAAVGTDEGVLVLQSEQSASLPNLVTIRVLERTTAAVLRDLGNLDLGGYYAITGTAVATAGGVYFATSSYATRDTVVWVRVGCE